MLHKLEVDSILLEFGSKRILSDIFISCETGKVTGLLGRNGQGKTCLMNIIFGTLKATDMSVRIDGKRIPHAYKTPGLVSYLPQFNFIPKSFLISRVFDDFELEFLHFENQFPEFKPKYKSRIIDLSGGEKRLVEIYVILKTKFEFAMLDEPFTHLMPIQIEKINELIQEEKKQKGILLTDHVYGKIIEIADRIYLLKEGKTHQINNTMEIESLGYARF